MWWGLIFWKNPISVHTLWIPLHLYLKETRNETNSCGTRWIFRSSKIYFFCKMCLLTFFMLMAQRSSSSYHFTELPIFNIKCKAQKMDVVKWGYVGQFCTVVMKARIAKQSFSPLTCKLTCTQTMLPNFWACFWQISLFLVPTFDFHSFPCTTQTPPANCLYLNQ